MKNPIVEIAKVLAEHECHKQKELVMSSYHGDVWKCKICGHEWLKQ